MEVLSGMIFHNFYDVLECLDIVRIISIEIVVQKVVESTTPVIKIVFVRVTGCRSSLLSRTVARTKILPWNLRRQGTLRTAAGASRTAGSSCYAAAEPAPTKQIAENGNHSRPLTLILCISLPLEQSGRALCQSSDDTAPISDISTSRRGC